MIALQNVSFSVKGSFILNDINLELRKGKVYGLLGPNGAGKTTLFKALLNTIAYKGDILRNPGTMTIGKLIEYPAFYPNLTCRENLNLHASYAELNLEGSTVSTLLRMVGLIGAENKKFKELSMGMKQRLGVAKALMGNPDLLLLDEPTNGLDPMGMKDMRDLVEQNLKNKNRTILISSHHLNEVSLITDTFLFMRNGETVLEMDNEEDLYIQGRIQQISNNISKKIAILEDDRKEKYFITSASKFNSLQTNKEFVYKDVQKLTLENLYINLMSSDLIEVKAYA